MKKILALALCLVMAFSFAACSKQDDGGAAGGQEDLKIGVILVGDENEGYTFAHIDGLKKAMEELGIQDSQVVWKYSVHEDETCYDAAAELADSGCDVIFSNSYGHQSYMVQAAEEFPEVQFVAMTGDTAAVCGLDNMHNAFTKVYESRYVSGVVAGMKLAELIESGKLTEANYEGGNVKIGYVGAYPYAEVVSGYTAFYLGVKSVVENVVMDVSYTNSWFDITAEGEAANALVARGCVIISQHADSTGAPAAIEAAFADGKVCYSVGYNVDMLSVAPNAALTSATNNWAVYYTYALKTLMDGGELPTDWASGYEEGAVAVTELGKSCAEGTAAKVAEVEGTIQDGTLKVFDVSKFTVNGAAIDSYEVDTTISDFSTGEVVYEGKKYEVIKDGAFSESDVRSAPYFDLRIDGITELN